MKVDYIGPKQHPDVVGRFDRITLTYADGTEVILDGNETLKEEPLLRGSNGLCVYKKSAGSKTLRLVDGQGRGLARYPRGSARAGAADYGLHGIRAHAPAVRPERE